MRTITLLVLIFISIALTPTAVFAGGSSPTDGVCGPLKDPGVTKGLFGLCVAYCEAGAHSEKVLDNYNRKRNEDDPPMPCLEEPTLSCACWNDLSIEDIGAGMEPSSCELEETGNSLFYFASESGNYELFSTGGSTCSYFNSATGASGNNEVLTPEQQVECGIELLSIAEQDFQGFPCLD